MAQETITDKYEEFRAPTGQFLPGNPGPELPPAKITKKEVTAAMRSAATPERVINVMDRMYKAAMNGSVKAAELWLSYGIGKPTTLEGDGNERLDVLQIAIARLQKSV